MKERDTEIQIKQKENDSQKMTDPAVLIERFMETRESYIRALESTIQVLKDRIDFHEQSETRMRKSLDELIAMQRLSNAISTATDSVSVFASLLDLTRQVIPVEESMIFEVIDGKPEVKPFLPSCSSYMMNCAQHLLEEGILDWVVAQKKTTVVPDLNTSVGEVGQKNFVVVPIILRNEAIGVYIIRTETIREGVSDKDLMLLSILSNQAAVAIENIKNIERLRRTADELKKSQAQMLQTAKLASVGELAGGIAHEINNPLQILLGHISLIGQGKDIAQRIEIIRNQVQRIAQITRQLVTFSRSVPQELEHEPVNVNWAINEMVTLVDHLFTSKGIELDLHFEDDLPPIRANKNYLQQVFLNLLINAKDAMPNGGKMTITTEFDDKNIVIKFTDNGVGIKKENIDRIFEAFFTTKEQGKGTGLGLSITRGIVRKFGGEIKVNSVEGHGTTFTIYLPINRQKVNMEAN
ncbi:MAG: ATP-binding protein [Candidatus Kryptoniota bacterium]